MEALLVDEFGRVETIFHDVSADTTDVAGNIVMEMEGVVLVESLPDEEPEAELYVQGGAPSWVPRHGPSVSRAPSARSQGVGLGGLG